MASWPWAPAVQAAASPHSDSTPSRRSIHINDVTSPLTVVRNRKSTRHRLYCIAKNDEAKGNNQTDKTGIQLYGGIERLLTETAKESQGAWGSSRNWIEVEALPEVPPAMADAVYRDGDFLATLTAGTPCETVTKEVSNTLGRLENSSRKYIERRRPPCKCNHVMANGK